MIRTIRENKIDIAIAAILFIVSYGLYYVTLAPDVCWEDSGELITAVSTLGISHTPGHPLYILLGNLSLYFHSNPAYALNLFSAIMGGFTVVFLYIAIFALLNGLNGLAEKKNRTHQRIIASASSLTFAVTASFWSQSLSAEVYTLQSFLTSLIVCLLIYWFFRGTGNRLLLLSAYILGLGLTNNITLIVLLPAILVLVMNRDRLKRPALSESLIALILFIFGLTLYIYLPIRSLSDPFLDWGNPETWDQFLWMLTMQEYAEGAGSTYAAKDVAASLISKKILLQFSWIGLILGVTGWAALFWRQQKIALFFTIIIILNLALSLFLGAGPDFEAYFLTSYLCFAILIASGTDSLIFLLKKVKNIKLSAVAIGASILLLISLIPTLGLVNYDQVEKRNAVWAKEFAIILSENLPEKAIFITDNTVDHFLLMYVQGVLDQRRDIANIYSPLLKFSWYREQVRERHPDLHFVEYSQDLSLTDAKVLQDFVGVNLSQDLYFTTARSWQINGNLLSPYGYVFRVTPDSLDLPRHFELTEKLDPKLPDHADKKTKIHYAIHHSTMGSLLWTRHERLAAIKEMNMAVKVNPDNAEVHFNLATAYENIAYYDSAISYYEKALELNPNSSISYFRVAMAFINMKLFESAIDYLQKALELQPHNPDYWYHLALVLSEEKQVGKSLDSIAKAVQYRPDFPEAYYFKGLLLRRREKLVESSEAFRKATDIRPKYLEAWLELGSNLLRLGDFDQSLSVFEKAVELDPKDPFAWFTLARVHTKREDKERMRQSLKKAIELGGSEIVYMARIDPILKNYASPIIDKYIESKNFDDANGKKSKGTQGPMHRSMSAEKDSL